MRFWTICSLLFSSVVLSSELNLKLTYLVDTAPRGIVFSNTKQKRIIEPRLCHGDLCLFVEKRELDLLNIDLGDNTKTILNTLKAMDELDKAWLFQQIQSLDIIQP